MEEFFSPNASEDQKTAPNIQRSDADQSQIIGRDADVDQSEIIGEDAYWGDISPIPWVSAPLYTAFLVDVQQ